MNYLDKIISVIFYKHNKTFFEKAISFYTGSPYSHCEILFENNECGTSHINYNGVVYYKRPSIDQDKWDFIDIFCSSKEYESIKSIFLNEEAGCGYDWRGIFLSHLLPIGIEHKDKWFCSEICCYALKRISYLQTYLKNIRPSSVSPKKLYNILDGISYYNPHIIVRKGIEK